MQITIKRKTILNTGKENESQLNLLFNNFNRVRIMIMIKIRVTMMMRIKMSVPCSFLTACCAVSTPRAWDKHADDDDSKKVIIIGFWCRKSVMCRKRSQKCFFPCLHTTLYSVYPPFSITHSYSSLYLSLYLYSSSDCQFKSTARSEIGGGEDQ